ncbi:nicotinate-mononucleotide:5, 6-dimethylbenzimidazole phosphoribosyltransferase CobT [Mycolicibacterium aurum]|uniref:Nicotinate-mononucleotide:5, 6-dimethylbenzimidazole phosphoribosyltransferase CobT n=2 Tax=Mycolicibacterium aurum TaxID=1791 RepID=A0A3S4VTL6_MYCAU|nr:nicotinate-mononucleotide:5, 6-dimethylbenzimidazole phosphoribosyltransferase CobT [Mycolicibacterium aurum]
MRGILAAAGAATVAAMSVGAPPTYTLTANVLTLNGYTFGGAIDGDMENIFNGAYCSEQSGNSCSEVRYLDGAPEVPAEITGLIALQWALATTPPPTTVLGYSQGATIASNWIKQNAGSVFAPSPDNLSFVLAANPQRKYGGIRSDLGIDTPTPDSQYSVVDIAIEYDGAADFPDNPLNILAVANALAGFQYVHIFGYADVDLETAEKLTWVDGNTTYVLIRSENIPLLQPLRLLGLTELADSLNAPLKAIIDKAYDRNYPGLVESATTGSVAQQLSASTDAEATDGTSGVQTASLDVQPAASTRTGRHAKVDTDELDSESSLPTVDLDEPSLDSDEDSDGLDGEAIDEDTAADDTDATDDTDGTDDDADTESSAAAESSSTPGANSDSDPGPGSESGSGSDSDSGGGSSDG